MAARSVQILMAFFLSLTFSLKISAQENLLKRQVSISYRDAPLERVLIGLAHEADFNFSYNAKIIDVDTTITINAVDTEVGIILKTILPDMISFNTSGNHLILLKEIPKEEEKEKKNAKYVIRGYVFDGESGKALVNVSVYDPSGLVSALSDSSGFYNLVVTTRYEQLNLFYSKKNFFDTLIIVEPVDQDIDILLAPLSEKPTISPIQKAVMPAYSPVEDIRIVQRFVPGQQRIQSENIAFDERRFAQISIIPRVSTNLRMPGNVENNLSLNVIAGYSAGVNGLEVGGLVNIDRKDMKGVQVAGLGNVVGGTVSGVQVAGIFNNIRKNVVGLQLAGVNNIILDTIKGAQIAGINNVLRGTMYGWQIAGINNFTTESVDGVQVAGVSNITKKDVDALQLAGVFNLGQNVNGFQITGLANVSRGHVGGWQIAGLGNFSKSVGMSQLAGLGNISSDSVNGVQVAALFNYSRYVGGGQVGLINIADTVGGTPIGFISFVKKGYNKIEVYAEEVLYANISYKMGVKKFYNMFTIGIQPGREKPVWGFGYGIGSQVGQGRFVANMDLKGTQIMENVPEQNLNVSFRLSTTLGIRIVKGLTFFFGPSLNLHVSDLKDPETGEFITNIAPPDLLLFENIPGTNTQFQLWYGGKVGFRLF